MHSLDDMYLFAQVVEAGSFTAAARSLGLQTSLLSRRISSLERDLGVRLLNRTTRKLAPTETGRGFYQHCQALVVEAEVAWQSVEQTRREPRGLVRLSCPVQLLHFTVAGIVTRFMARHPQVRVHVEATNRRVDLIEEGIDIALRVRQPPLGDSELVVRQLGTSEVAMVGAPALLAKLPRRPATLADLAGVPTLAQARAGEQHAWEFIGPDGQRAVHRHVPRLTVDDFTLLRQATIDGLGIACLPGMVVREDVIAGRLEPVLPGYRHAQGIAHLVFPSRRGMVPAVRALVDALAAEFRID
jgi:DNA-binding transcriptional LysR family regulator